MKHQYEPVNDYKMDGKKQEHYRRKNWSSLILWNCGHDLNKGLTPLEVNTQKGSYLHGFE